MGNREGVSTSTQWKESGSIRLGEHNKIPVLPQAYTTRTCFWRLEVRDQGACKTCPSVCDGCRLAGCSHDLFFVQVLEGGGGKRESSGVSS